MPLLNIPGFNMEYYFIKVIHIISASWLLGYLVLNLVLSSALPIKWLKLFDTITFIAFLIQPITGFIIIAIKPYNLMGYWIIESLLGYAIVCCLWFSLLFYQYRSIYLMQISTHNQPHIQSLHFRYKRYRKMLLALCLLVLTVMYHLMVGLRDLK